MPFGVELHERIEFRRIPHISGPSGRHRPRIPFSFWEKSRASAARPGMRAGLPRPRKKPILNSTKTNRRRGRQTFLKVRRGFLRTATRPVIHALHSSRLRDPHQCSPLKIFLHSGHFIIDFIGPIASNSVCAPPSSCQAASCPGRCHIRIRSVPVSVCVQRVGSLIVVVHNVCVGGASFAGFEAVSPWSWQAGSPRYDRPFVSAFLRAG